MESVTVKDVILDKKMDGYNWNKDDYSAQGELTVTITLSEYRNLVSNVATRDAAIGAANADKYTRNQENEQLKKEVAALKAELYEYQKRLDPTTANDKEGA